MHVDIQTDSGDPPSTGTPSTGPPSRDRRAAGTAGPASPVRDPSLPGPTLAAELRGSAMLFGLALVVTAGVAAGASALLQLF